jgi:hypothetical protein
VSALTIGLGIGKSMWHLAFAQQGIEKWTPFFLLVAGIASAQTELQKILDGSYRGGEADRSRIDSAPTQEAPKLS